jgi:uncharacterized protein YuzE
MLVKYDKEVDALRIQFKSISVRNQQIDDDVIIDLDKDNSICGIEVLNASKKLFDNQSQPEMIVENLTVATV